MKNIEQISAREQVSQASKIEEVSNAERPVKVLGTQNSEDRVNNIQDKFTPSLDVPQLPTYGSIQIKLAPDIKIDPNQAEIILPKDKSYVNTNEVEKYAKTSDDVMNLDKFRIIIMGSEDFETLKKVLLWCKQRPGGSLFIDCLKTAADWYSNKLLEHDYFKNTLKISFHSEGTVSFNAVPSERTIMIWNKMNPNILSLEDKFKCKFQSILAICHFAMCTNDINMLDKNFRSILGDVSRFLKLPIAQNKEVRTALIDALYITIKHLVPNYQNQYISKYYTQCEENLTLSNTFGNMLFNNQDFKLAVSVIGNALAKSKEPFGPEVSYSLNMLTLAINELEDKALALHYASEIYARWPDQPDALKKVLHLAKLVQDFALVDKMISEVRSPDFKNLLLVYNNWNMLENPRMRDLVSAIKEENIPSIYHDTLKSIHFLSMQVHKTSVFGEPSYSKQLETSAKEFIDKRAGTVLSIISMINACQFLKKPNVTASILRNTDPQLVKSDPMLRKYKTLLSETSTQEISEYNIPEIQKADLHFSAASSCIVAENFESASEHLQAAIDAQPENEEYKQVSFLAAVLTDDQARIKSGFNKLDTETQAELFSTFTHEAATTESTTELTSATSTTVGTNYSEVEFDHQKIHAHFQAIKAQRLNELSSFSNSSSGWKVGDANIPTSKAVPLGTHNGLTYYGYIADKFQGAENAAFKTALEKGFAKRAEGVNGVKAFKGVFEIKIDGDARLYTNKVYKNEQGQLLLFFDRYGNHDAVELFARNTKRIAIPA
jgi:hypothetical protein